MALNTIPAAASPQALLTTTGDTLYASAANIPARLGVGTNGQYLTTNGTIPSWGTVSAGSMTLLSTTTMSGATVTLSSIDQSYVQLFVKISGVTLSSGPVNLIVKPNATANLAVGSKVEAATAGQYAEQNLTLNSTSSGFLNTGGENTWAISFQNYNSTTKNKTYSYQGYMVNSASSAFYGVMSAGGIKISAAAITSIEFSNSSGYSFDGGTILLYGVK